MKNHISDVEVVHKDVVVIGNGPSGISLSMMLSGYLPYLKSVDHPDEMLSARLYSATTQSLAQQPLDHLAAGLEGRSTNPVSLLVDALEHPCADLGIEMDSLVQWRHHKDKEIDHVVFGKGPPGGSWHTMDPNVLTLSLGSWMALPGLPYSPADNSDSQRRASAGSVAQYYETYVRQMNLTKYFRNGVRVISIEPIHNKTAETDIDVDSEKQQLNHLKVDNFGLVNKKDNDLSENPRRKCSFVNAFNFIRSRTKCHKSSKPKVEICTSGSRSCKRPRDTISKHDNMSPNRKVRDRSFLSGDKSVIFTRLSRENFTFNNEDVLVCDSDICNIYSTKTFMCELPKSNKVRSVSLSYDSSTENTAKICDNSFKSIDHNQKHNSLINISDCRLCQCFQNVPPPSSTEYEMEILCECADDQQNECSTLLKNIPRTAAKWLVKTFDQSTGRQIDYTCTNLVLANGASDQPNRLGLSAETYDLPWVLHDLRKLEEKLDEFTRNMERTPDPVLVVGAGLSAADAVIATRFRSIPVLHVFRNRSVSLDKQLPENMYPEYHKVHQMMIDGGSTYPLYTALPEHTVLDISSADKAVTLLSKSGLVTQHKVSFAVILIGSRPNLKFLPPQCSIGINKSKDIDAKSNPIDIDSMTHSVNGFDGLYAIGPLAGDNFVRFIPGGALAVVSDLYKKRHW